MKVKQIAQFAALFIIVFWMLGMAGKFDYNEAVISGINHKAYWQIVEKVGDDRDDIVREYKLRKDYYDSLRWQ